MIRKLAVLTVAFFAVSVPLYSQDATPAQTAPAQEAQPAAAAQPVQAEPAATGATFESAMKLYRRGRYSAAAEQLEQVAATDSTNSAAAWYFAGYAHYVQKHLEKAQENFAKAFAANPTFDPRPYFKS
jgi:tetratricopeptide (TPR) repeat protein